MEIIQRFHRGAVVVRMQGGYPSERDLARLDLITVSYANSGMKLIVFDIRGVDGVGDQMLKSLRRAVKTMGRNHGQVRFVRPRQERSVHRPDLFRYFQTFSTVDQALEEAAPGR